MYNISGEWLEAVIVLLVAVAGLCFGSFVSLVSYRLPRDEPMGAQRSRCPSCRTPLGVRALMPLFSWLLQRGKCRYCHKKISARYPVTELVQALLFLAVYAAYGVSWQGVMLSALTVVLLVMVVVDFEWYIIPDEVQVSAAVFGIGFHMLGAVSPLMVLAGVAMGAFIGFALRFGYGWVMRKEGLGWGDVKFLVVAGLWLADVDAWPVFLFMAGCWGVVTAIVWRLLGKGERFPFGPALAVALLTILLTPVVPLFYWTIDRFYA